MKKTSIKVAETSQNFANCANEEVCFGLDLTVALASVELQVNEARAWNRELRAARDKLKSPTNEW
jgi:hypothetical protein